MDSTLINQEVIDEIAVHAGVGDEVTAVTHRAMQGQLDFHESLKQRVSLLRGVKREILLDVQKALVFTRGSRSLCKRLHDLGFKLAVISGGFSSFARLVKDQLHLDHAFANEMEFDEQGKVTGNLLGPVVTPQRKASLLRMLADLYHCCPQQVIAVGDGANDIPMILAAGIGVAFCAKVKVQEEAEFRINNRDLYHLIYLLGV
eukprot:Selendium_serpulae@DN4509_c0_g1_i1.p1